MSLGERELQELIGSQQGKWICHPEVCFTPLHPSNWHMCLTRCTNSVQVQRVQTVFMLQRKWIRHTAERIDAFVSFPPLTFLHNLSTG